MNKNKGISLIVLVMTIVVMIIITGAVVLSVTTSLSEARVTAFAQELSEIESAVLTYYYADPENNLPTVDGSDYTLDTLSTIQTDANKLSELKLQISDLEKKSGVTDVTTVSFGKLDLNKIEASQTKRGLGTTSDDIFIVSKSTMNVYYVKGYKVDGVYYFALNEQLSGITKLPIVQNNADTTNPVTPGVRTLKLSKDISTWASSVTIDTHELLLEGEKLYLSISKFSVTNTDTIPDAGDATWIKATTNMPKIDNKSELLNSDAKIASFIDQTQANYRVAVCKTNSAGNPIAFGIIKLENIDFKAPTLTITKGTEFSDFYMLDLAIVENKLTASDVGSGIAEIKWAAGTFTNISGSAMNPNVNYFDIAGQSVEDVSSNNISIKIEPKATPVYVYIKDNAGNFSIVQYNG